MRDHDVPDVLAQAARPWPPSLNHGEGRVETLELREGIDLVLTRIGPFDAEEYRYVEPGPVVALGFHLKGGAHFNMEGVQFSTRPLDVWAGATPRGSRSTFRLPEAGTHTVSIRFSPAALGDLLKRLGADEGPLCQMARSGADSIATARLAPLDPATAQTVQAMLAPPYVGSARMLHLESCALGLIAAQLAALEGFAPAIGTSADRERMLRARLILDEQLDAPPTLLELARRVGVNDFKLKQSFKAVFGVTVFGYVRQRRMERAVAQLHAGLSVAEAAAVAGYECPRSFATAFRRQMGVLPSEVTRRNLRNLPQTAHQAPAWL